MSHDISHIQACLALQNTDTNFFRDEDPMEGIDVFQAIPKCKLPDLLRSKQFENPLPKHDVHVTLISHSADSYVYFSGLKIEPAVPQHEPEYSLFTSQSFIGSVLEAPDWMPVIGYCGFGETSVSQIESIQAYASLKGTADKLHRNSQKACRNDQQSDSYFAPVYKRLQEFLDEPEGWDGEGSVPASQETADEIHRFVGTLPHNVRRPGAAMGADGSIALVWQDDTHYFTADFYGNGYFTYVMVENKKIVEQGSSPIGEIPKSFTEAIKANFPRG